MFLFLLIEKYTMSLENIPASLTCGRANMLSYSLALAAEAMMTVKSYRRTKQFFLHYTVENVENIGDPVNKAIKKFKFHSILLRIKYIISKSISQNLFCFNKVTKTEVLK